MQYNRCRHLTVALNEFKREMWVLLLAAGSGYLARCWQKAVKPKSNLPSCDLVTPDNSGISFSSPSSRFSRFPAKGCFRKSSSRRSHTLKKPKKSLFCGGLKSGKGSKKIGEARKEIRPLIDNGGGPVSDHGMLTKMTGPCCGLVGNIDVQEGNLIPIPKKGRKGDFTKLANAVELATEDQNVGRLKPSKDSPALLQVQHNKANKSRLKKTVEGLNASGCLPLFISGSYKRSLNATQTSQRGPSSLQVPVHPDGRIEKVASKPTGGTSIREEKIAALEINSSEFGTLHDVVMQSTKESPKQTFVNEERTIASSENLSCTTRVSTAFEDQHGEKDIRWERNSVPHQTHMPISGTGASYPRRVFLMVGRGRQRFSATRERRKSSCRMHSVLRVSDSHKLKGESCAVVTGKTTNDPRKDDIVDGNKEDNCSLGKQIKDESEGEERAVEGDVCLSSFTFGPQSHSHSPQADYASSVLPLPEGKKLYRRLPRKSSNSRLPVNQTKDRWSECGLVRPSSVTHSALSSSTGYLQTSLSQMKEKNYTSSVSEAPALPSEEGDCRANEIGPGDLRLSAHKPGMQLNIQALECYKVSNMQQQEMQFSSNNVGLPPLRRKLMRRRHLLFMNSKKTQFQHAEDDTMGSTTVTTNCAQVVKGLSGKTMRFKKRKISHCCQSSSLGVDGYHYSGEGFTNWLPQESTFSLGVVFGISYMLVSSRKEVERLSKLLEHTEALVHDMKQQLQCGRVFFPAESSSKSGSPKMHTTEIKKSDTEIDSQRIQKELAVNVCHAGITTDGPQFNNQDSVQTVLVEPNPESSHMAELEAALEAEFELMQLNLTSGSNFKNQESAVDFSEWNSIGFENSEIGDLKADGLSRRLDLEETREHSAHAEVQWTNYAVSPSELDRRLREVLEARQEERILELEAQLEATETKLVLKERELQCWKDIVRQVTDSSLASSGDGTEIITINNDKAAVSVGEDSCHVAVVSETAENSWEALSTQVLSNSSQSDSKISMQKLPFSSTVGSSYKRIEEIKTVDVPVLKVPSESKNEAAAHDLETSFALCPYFEDCEDSLKIVTEFSTSLYMQSPEIETSANLERSFGDIKEQTLLLAGSKDSMAWSSSKASETGVSRSITIPLTDQWDFGNHLTATRCNFMKKGGLSKHTEETLSGCLTGSEDILDLGAVNMDMDRVATANGYVDRSVKMDEKNSLPKLSKNFLHNNHGHEVVEVTNVTSDCNWIDTAEGCCYDSNAKRTELCPGNKSGPFHWRRQFLSHAGANTPVGSFRYRNEPTQIAAKALVKPCSVSERSLKVTSPVLDKIKHWETLGRGKTVVMPSYYLEEIKKCSQNQQRCTHDAEEVREAALPDEPSIKCVMEDTGVDPSMVISSLSYSEKDNRSGTQVRHKYDYSHNSLFPDQGSKVWRKEDDESQRGFGTRFKAQYKDISVRDDVER